MVPVVRHLDLGSDGADANAFDPCVVHLDIAPANTAAHANTLAPRVCHSEAGLFLDGAEESAFGFRC